MAPARKQLLAAGHSLPPRLQRRCQRAAANVQENLRKFVNICLKQYENIMCTENHALCTETYIICTETDIICTENKKIILFEISINFSKLSQTFRKYYQTVPSLRALMWQHLHGQEATHGMEGPQHHFNTAERPAASGLVRHRHVQLCWPKALSELRQLHAAHAQVTLPSVGRPAAGIQPGHKPSLEA